MKFRITRVYIIISISILTSLYTFAQNAKSYIEPGKVWLDTDGQTIEAHGGGVIKHGDTYYWYGENHKLGEGNKIGISCYSSTDLLNWKNEGVVLPKEKLPEMFRDKGVCERPKVIYNPKTGKFIMWMHLDANNYTEATAGVAVADNPNGPFEFKAYKRPIGGSDYDYTLGRVSGISNREKELWNAFRDMNLFVDTDGKAYVIYSSEDLAALYCARLNTDFTDIERPAVKGKTWERIMPGQYREAPVLFKHQGKYYILSSGTSGWDPNPADLAVADSLFGPYKKLGNPCFGGEAGVTFRSQSTCVIPLPEKGEGSFIYMGDRWNGSSLEKSTYVWLPFCMNQFGNVKMVLFDKWNLSIFDPLNKPLIAPQIVDNHDNNTISWKRVENAHAYKIFNNGKLFSITDSTKYTLPIGFWDVIDNITVQAWNIKGVNSEPSNLVTRKWPNTGSVFLSDKMPEYSKQDVGIRRDKSIQQNTLNIAGKEFKKGLGTHACSEVIYRIGGKYHKFSSWIGVDNFTKINSISSLQFEVWSDGDLLYRSKVMRVKDAAEFIELNITGTNELKLVVTDGGDGKDWDHADWAEAKIE